MTTIHNGDCIEIMNQMPAESVDAIVTDPPYGLGFMGKKWDTLPPSREWAEACYRVLKPGGHIAAFGGTRTWHRLAVAIEDAGFEMRDSLAWLYGSGFPKSMNVGKAIDKIGGARDVTLLKSELRRVFDASGLTHAELNERCGFEASGYLRTSSTWAAVMPTPDKWAAMRAALGTDEDFSDAFRAAEREVVGRAAWSNSANHFVPGEDHSQRVQLDITAPATPEAAQWDGWGTALKPAFEPIVLARKPLAEKTVARNVLAHGTGAINVDACRIGTTVETWPKSRMYGGKSAVSFTSSAETISAQSTGSAPSGRWPANVLLDHHAAGWVDEQSGHQKDGTRTSGPRSIGNGFIYSGHKNPESVPEIGYGGSGGASRFFYSAKAPKSERPNVDGVQHPTVKPLAIMRWPIRLVTPPGGVVLDPFAGSGTTIEAAIIEGFNPVGIEMETDYLPLIQHRIDRQSATLTA